MPKDADDCGREDAADDDWHDLRGHLPSPRAELLIDLRGRALTEGQFWEEMARGCQLPGWFGRNLDAWEDTLRGGISRFLDAHFLVVRVSRRGAFEPGRRFGRIVEDIFQRCPYARIELF